MVEEGRGEKGVCVCVCQVCAGHISGLIFRNFCVNLMNASTFFFTVMGTFYRIHWKMGENVSPLCAIFHLSIEFKAARTAAAGGRSE